MRWLPFIAIFLYVYIEISIFIQVAHVLGVLLTLVLVIFTSVIGMSLVRNQGFKNFVLMQQKMAAGENPAAEMIKSVSLIIAVCCFYYRAFSPISSVCFFITAGAKASDSEVDASSAFFPYARWRF